MGKNISEGRERESETSNEDTTVTATLDNHLCWLSKSQSTFPHSFIERIKLHVGSRGVDSGMLELDGDGCRVVIVS